MKLLKGIIRACLGLKSITTSLKTISWVIIGLGLAANAYSQSFLTNGLVAYYPFNGNANDASGNGNNGTLAGGSDWQYLQDRFGQYQGSLFLNANSPGLTTINGAYVTMVRSAALDFNKDFTLSIWVNVSPAMTNQQTTLISAGSDGEGGALNLSISPYSSLFGGNDSFGVGWGGTNGVGYVAAPVRNTWWLLVLTRSGSITTLFKNGIALTNEVLLTAPNNFPNIWLGRFQPVPAGNPGHTLSFFGGIDDVRMYNRALSDSEVGQLYEYEVQASGPSVDLIRAVKPSFRNLMVTTNYQLQVSADMNSWTNHGGPFTATNTSMVYPEYWHVDNWNSLFFRLQTAP